MKKIALALGFAVAISGVAAAADLADVGVDADAIHVFWGGILKEDSYSVNAGIVAAINGDLSQDGFLVRLHGSFGEYEYDTGSVSGGEVDVDVLTGDAMIGYQMFTDDLRLTLYAGGNIQDRDMSPNDSTSETQGSEEGFKVQGEVRALPSSPLFFSVLSHYSTAHDTYYAQLRLGMDLGGLTVGPEGTVLGNTAYDNQRIGVFVSGISLGPINSTVHGGYSFASGEGDDSFYVGASSSFNF